MSLGKMQVKRENGTGGFALLLLAYFLPNVDQTNVRNIQQQQVTDRRHTSPRIVTVCTELTVTKTTG